MFLRVADDVTHAGPATRGAPRALGASRCFSQSRRLSARARPAARGQRGEPALFPSLSDKTRHSEWGVTVQPLLVTSRSSSATRPRARETPGSAGHTPSRGVSAPPRGCPFPTGQGGVQLLGSQPGRRLGGGRPTKVRERWGEAVWAERACRLSSPFRTHGQPTPRTDLT